MKNNRGQIVVEYLLLLVVGVALAALLIKQLASRDPENPGMIVQKWNSILQTIGDDIID
ncbi:MAG TPA: hypothetical protein PLJ21_11775 [Pseudobdellovibrionaceae bacterium]|nr:hypothetical protein [Pseudobdellovibrionaceae bacterium]